MVNRLLRAVGAPRKITARLGVFFHCGTLVAVTSLGFLVAFPALALDYSDNGDGTIKDPNTGVTWMRCSWGQTWTGSVCAGTPKVYTFDRALDLNGKVSFAGYNDWRVPSVAELRGIVIVDMTRPGPSINEIAFPNTPTHGYWSGTVHPHLSNYAWFVDFDSGGANGAGRDSRLFVRLVRGGN